MTISYKNFVFNNNTIERQPRDRPSIRSAYRYQFPSFRYTNMWPYHYDAPWIHNHGNCLCIKCPSKRNDNKMPSILIIVDRQPHRIIRFKHLNAMQNNNSNNLTIKKKIVVRKTTQRIYHVPHIDVICCCALHEPARPVFRLNCCYTHFRLNNTIKIDKSRKTIKSRGFLGGSKN